MWESYVAAHVDYETEYSQVMSSLNDIDTRLSHCCDQQAVEELSTRLQVLPLALLVT